MNRNPLTWNQARWPYPRPGHIRRHLDLRDVNDVCYARIDAVDVEHLDMRRGRGTWYWSATPHVEADMPEQGTIVTMLPNRMRFRVTDVAVHALPRRRVAALCLKRHS